MTTLAERVSDPDDPLRALLQAARRWQVPPTVFIRRRTVNSREWTDADTDYAMALEDYEAGLCGGCGQPLDQTTRQDHADAYRPGEAIRCHYCTAHALMSEVAEKDEHAAGVMMPIVLDPDVVEQNRKPVPPLPPELMPT